MKTTTLSLAILLLALGALTAQVPQLIHYQGRVTVGATNFDGAGYFKFALVDGAGTTLFWTNDGTTPVTGEPATAVQLTVNKGLYSVLLGDTAVPNMTPIPASIFANDDVRLRVWFDDGVNGFEKLSPDQRLAAVGYAMMADSAASVADGAITSAKIAAGAVGSAHLEPGAAAANLEASGQGGVASGGLVLSRTENQALINAGYVKIGGGILSTDGWAQGANGPSGRRYHTAVWTGSEMIVWGGTGPGFVPSSAGSRYNPATNSWTPVTTNGAPAPRGRHTAVWTGSEMIVWGGETPGGYLGDGGRYDPSSDSWTAINMTGAPEARSGHTAVWTGSEMIVWGGDDINGGFSAGGGRYDPATDTWRQQGMTEADQGLSGHTAVWTGSEMIVWQGPGIGWRYDPPSDSWSSVTSSGAPSARLDYTAVWTGTEMIVWGGYFGFNDPLNNGARYNPATDGWAPMQAVSLNGRYGHTAVWTGREMVVWGGRDTSTAYDDGSRYDPATNTWTALPMDGAPSARSGQTAVWTGIEMILWGGTAGSSFFEDTRSYSPGTMMFLYQKR